MWRVCLRIFIEGSYVKCEYGCLVIVYILKEVKDDLKCV